MRAGSLERDGRVVERPDNWLLAKRHNLGFGGKRVHFDSLGLPCDAMSEDSCIDSSTELASRQSRMNVDWLFIGSSLHGTPVSTSEEFL